jgi:hypothetical protein
MMIVLSMCLLSGVGISPAVADVGQPEPCVVEPCVVPGIPATSATEPVPPIEGTEPVPLEECPELAGPPPPPPTEAVGVLSIVCLAPVVADPEPGPGGPGLQPAPAAALAQQQAVYEVQIGYARTGGYFQKLNNQQMFLGHELRIFSTDPTVVSFEGAIEGGCGYPRPDGGQGARGFYHSFNAPPIGDVFTGSYIFPDPAPVVSGTDVTAAMTAVGLSAKVAVPGKLSRFYQVKAALTPYRFPVP